jgi:hypothetical protein
MTVKNKKDAGDLKSREMAFEEHVDRCLSMVYHYPEVEQIGAIIKRIGIMRLQRRETVDEAGSRED